jgi:hypothetical protein
MKEGDLPPIQDEGVTWYYPAKHNFPYVDGLIRSVKGPPGARTIVVVGEQVTLRYVLSFFVLPLRCHQENALVRSFDGHKSSPRSFMNKKTVQRWTRHLVDGDKVSYVFRWIVPQAQLKLIKKGDVAGDNYCEDYKVECVDLFTLSNRFMLANKYKK